MFKHKPISPRKMKKILLLCIVIVATLHLGAQTVALPEGKAIYIPKDLQDIDLQNPDSRWSYHRMACTDNFAIFWEKGFGDDLANPPALEGHPMSVSLPNLEEKLERFYRFFADTLQFVKPGSKSEKYRMMVMLNYSLEGTAYGGDYDGEIGALWIAPGRVQDERLNCIAHELGHSYHCMMSCHGEGEGWGGSGFVELTSQWMLWQVNPDWITDERYHFDAFTHLTHKAFLHLENIYHSPYVIEYWGMKHGLPFIAELFRKGKKGDDPVITYKELTGLSQQAFCDEMFDACRHFINWDFPRVWDATRPYTNAFHTKLNALENGWLRVDSTCCPENYGFNAIPLAVPKAGKKVTIEFQGETSVEGFHNAHADKAGWRYGFVAVNKEGKSCYGDMCSATKGKLSYTLPKDDSIEHLWLVVMGAPADHWKNPEPPFGEDGPVADIPLEKDDQWPYRIRLKGTTPLP